MAGTFLASEVRILWRVMESQGVDIRRVCRDSGLSVNVNPESRARYPFERVAVAWQRAAELSGNPHIGLELGKFYRATDFHGIAVVFLASDCLRTALQRLVRYHVVVNTAVSMKLEENDGRLDLLGPPIATNDMALAATQDARAALVVDLCRTAAATELDPVEVAFTYPEPSDLTRHKAVFRSELKFNAPQWRLSFRLADAAKPFLASNRELALSNDHVLDQMVRGLREDTLVARVKLALIDELPSGAPSDGSIAKAVSLSTRFLAAQAGRGRDKLHQAACPGSARTGRALRSRPAHPGDRDRLPVGLLRRFGLFAGVQAMDRCFPDHIAPETSVGLTRSTPGSSLNARRNR